MRWKIANEVRSAELASASGIIVLFEKNAHKIWMLLKRGTGSGERGTEVWERVVSGNLHKNLIWPMTGGVRHEIRPIRMRHL